MAEREDVQDVPTSKNDPSRSKQYACVADSNKAGRAAHRTPDRILERFGGAENPGQLAGVHRSESAGAALLTEQATYQQASDSAAVLDDSYHGRKCEVPILRADEAELFRCGTPVGELTNRCMSQLRCLHPSVPSFTGVFHQVHNQSNA